MNTKSSAGEKLSSFVVGLAILLPGLFFMVLGVTFLPVIGLIMGLPIMALSVRFMMVSLRQDVDSLNVEVVAEKAAVAISEMLETAPQKPQIIRMPLPETGGATTSHLPLLEKAA
jgi:hypothetical protein